jgi:hypothetical protein
MTKKIKTAAKVPYLFMINIFCFRQKSSFYSTRIADNFYCRYFLMKNKKENRGLSSLFGSPSWTRTSNPAVNSRMLYLLSYRGINLLLAMTYSPKGSRPQYPWRRRA